jgi:hypothetical protein
MKGKKFVCVKSGCTNEPYLGGLCRRHHDEDEVRRRLRSEALTALHSGTVDGELPKYSRLQDELERLQVYWNRVCTVVQTQRGTVAMPLDEADYATEWCITLAEEIVKAEHQIAKGQAIPTSFEVARQWVWERLRNLDAGLRSNGRPRE